MLKDGLRYWTLRKYLGLPYSPYFIFSPDKNRKNRATLFFDSCTSFFMDRDALRGSSFACATCVKIEAVRLQGDSAKPRREGLLGEHRQADSCR